MTAIAADAALLTAARQADAPTPRASLGRIVGYALLAGLGLVFGLIAGIFLVVSTGLITLC